jgi:hypothetical protein
MFRSNQEAPHSRQNLCLRIAELKVVSEVSSAATTAEVVSRFRDEDVMLAGHHQLRRAVGGTSFSRFSTTQSSWNSSA